MVLDISAREEEPMRMYWLRVFVGSAAAFVFATACGGHVETGEGEGRTEAARMARESVGGKLAQPHDLAEVRDLAEAPPPAIVQARIGPSDVGVLAPAGMNCPDEHVMIALENERENNWNEKEGWIGASEQDRSFTKLHLCRTDGRNFRQASGTSTSLNYAVVKLGDSCPAGAVELERYFDNEDRPRGCPSWPRACAGGEPATIGDYQPSYYSSNNLHLKLCLFRSAPSGSSTPLPTIGIPYGVFAAASFPGAVSSGWIHTDDEDDDNANSLTGDFVGSEVFLTPGGNTTLYLVEVDPAPSGPLVWRRNLDLRLAR